MSISDLIKKSFKDWRYAYKQKWVNRPTFGGGKERKKIEVKVKEPFSYTPEVRTEDGFVFYGRKHDWEDVWDLEVTTNNIDKLFDVLKSFRWTNAYVDWRDKESIENICEFVKIFRTKEKKLKNSITIIIKDIRERFLKRLDKHFPKERFKSYQGYAKGQRFYALSNGLADDMKKRLGYE